MHSVSSICDLPAGIGQHFSRRKSLRIHAALDEGRAASGCRRIEGNAYITAYRDIVVHGTALSPFPASIGTVLPSTSEIRVSSVVSAGASASED